MHVNIFHNSIFCLDSHLSKIVDYSVDIFKIVYKFGENEEKGYTKVQ